LWNTRQNWSSGGLYLNLKDNRAFIRVDSSFSGTYTIQPSVTVVADGAFDGVNISRIDPALKRSHGAVWYKD
jgi:hypothetical protein